MLNFIYEKEILLRKESQFYDIFIMEKNKIVMLIKIANEYYFDVLLQDLYQKQELIQLKLQFQPIFVFKALQNVIGFLHPNQLQQNSITYFNFNTNSLINNGQIIQGKFKQSILFESTNQFCIVTQMNQKIYYYYLTEDSISQHQICQNNVEIYEIYQLDQISKLAIRYYSNEDLESFLAILEKNQQEKLIPMQKQVANLSTCSIINNNLILIYTPFIGSSLIKILNMDTREEKIVEIQYFDFAYSIEEIIYQNETQFWCKITTDLENDIEILAVIDKETFQMISHKIYKDDPLSWIKCNENILIELKYELLEKVFTLEGEEQQQAQIIQNEEIQNKSFESVSYIKIYYNLNPLYQAYKIIKHLGYDDSVAIFIIMKIIE